MSNRRAAPTIDLEVRTDGVWVPRKPARPVPTQRPPKSPLWILWTIPAAVTGFIVAVVLLGLPQQSQASAASWRAMVKGDQIILSDAVVVGTEESLPLYACRAPYKGAVEVGRYRADFTGCHVAHEGHERELTPFEVLTVSWQPSTEVPPGSLVAGELFGVSDNNVATVPLYSCRALYQNNVHPGEIAAGGRGCSFGFGGQVLTVASFSVLQQAAWLTWVPAVASALPPAALVGGQEGGEPFFVCRAHDGFGLHPGKIKQSVSGCSIASHGHEAVERQFEVLVPRWIVTSGGAVPVAAAPAGMDSSGIQYVCRGQDKDMVQVGQVNTSLSSCRVGVQGGEIGLEDYEVLSQ